MKLLFSRWKFWPLVPLFLFASLGWAFEEISDDAVLALPKVGDDFDIESGKLLAPILIPRVPGTPGSEKVRQHFLRFFRENLPAWTIEEHRITDKTPLTGDEEVPFTNLVFTRQPSWAKNGSVGYLSLAAHYDSLVTPQGFIGAIDSAAPCAMLLHVARSLDAALTKKWKAMEEAGEQELEEHARGVQIILLDGEEAWQKWSATDSLYGARALAKAWDEEFYTAHAPRRSRIGSIDLFLLLDLLGSANPSVSSYFLTTHWAYQAMALMEHRLRELGVLETGRVKASHDSFAQLEKNADDGSGRDEGGSDDDEGTKDRRATNPDVDVRGKDAELAKPFLPDVNKSVSLFNRGFIGDDHEPFMKRGVPILHLIAFPFPSVWHRMEDDGEHLDLPTCRDWAMIVTGFAAEWMELDGYL